MKKYYSVFASDDFNTGNLPMAWLRHEFQGLSLEPTPLDDPTIWPTVVFELRVIVHAEWKEDEPALEFADYMANSEGWPLCSPRLKRVLEEESTEHDTLNWLPASVVNDQGETRKYFIACFRRAFPKSIDKDGSLFNDAGSPVQVAFDPEELSKHGVFVYRENTVGLIVSEDVKRRVGEEQLTGIELEEERIRR